MEKDRIVLLDSLRGLAVLGILICNIPLAAEPHAVATSLTGWPHGMAPASVGVWWITQVFFQQKFYTLFSMLFGVSILLVGGPNGEGSDGGRTAILVRRLLSLLVLGVLHGALLWNGDVLTYYALLGLVVMLARSWSPWRLLAAGVALDLTLSAATGIKLLADTAHPALPQPADLAGQAIASARYAGTFAQSLAQNFADYRTVMSHVWQQFPSNWPLTVLALMLMGMGLFKLGVLSGRAGTATYRALAAAGLFALLIGALPWALYVAAPDHPAVLRELARWTQRATAPVVGLGYAGLLVLAAGARTWKAIPAMLAPVGQMAFTNYIAQSAVMTIAFYGGRGPALYGQLDRPALAAIVVATWIAQTLWSRWWMARFTMGPLEWVWRLAYRGRTPLRRAGA
ncbi:DUF418 domain-containing protein [Caulobacter segnis]|uniref:DUF418 domain-containing protein n=1 Tax=Caulobacter segnis TaxID=88688 RepID=UPI001CBC2503|nr:DUF418 domain-containing protein [Caulobacter segnis]UAL09674.1 DUF418 domain-containing protein [Caulobacter segnis]